MEIQKWLMVVASGSGGRRRRNGVREEKVQGAYWQGGTCNNIVGPDGGYGK
jgi:hypothetical protein